MTEEMNNELNFLMQKGFCLKVSGKNYLLYNREWLYENLDLEYERIKKLADEYERLKKLAERKEE